MGATSVKNAKTAMIESPLFVKFANGATITEEIIQGQNAQTNKIYEKVEFI